MGIVVDLADPETDIEDVKTVVEQNTTEELREAMFSHFQYGFGEIDSIQEETLQKVSEYAYENGIILTEGQDADDFRELLDEQREQNLTHGGQMKELFSELVVICRYVFLSEGMKKAQRSQKRGISKDWNMTLTIPAT